MSKEVREALKFRGKMTVLEYALLCRHVTKDCIEFEVPSSSSYEWKKAFAAKEKARMARKKPIAQSHHIQVVV